MTTAAQATLGPGDRYRVLRELGRRTRKTFAAIREPHELLVLQRFLRRDGSTSGVAEVRAEGGSSPNALTPLALPDEAASFVTAEQIALLLRDARSLEKHWHPNVARVKHVAFAGGDLRVATELIDGVTLADLLAGASSRSETDRARLLSLPVLLRVLVDVLGGLHGLHGLRDATMAPLEAMHGELSPVNVVVGRDGVARLVAVLRPRPVRLVVGSEATGYAAPEMMDNAAVPDARADVYAVGVMLWEAMRGERLYDSGDLAAVAQLQRSEELEAPELPSTSPFAPLADVAMRALAFDPALRFRTASEMATEIRRIAGTSLAPGSVVAQAVAELAGERIRARRAELDPIASGTRKRAPTGSLPPNAEALDQSWVSSESDAPPEQEAVTGRIDEAPLPVVSPAEDEEEDADQEVTKVAGADGEPAPGATPVGPRTTTTAPLDPPRASPKSDARYLVVPPRPMLESVDSEALADEETRRHVAAEEPSTSRLKVAAPGAGVPRPRAGTPAPGATTAPAPRAPAVTPPAGSARPPKLYEPDPEPNAETSIEITSVEILSGAPTDEDITAVGKGAAPTAALSSPPKLPERGRPSQAPQAPKPLAPGAPSPAASAVGAENASARAEIPRLWTESSPDFPSTNVLEGDFVRALKSAASEPPAPAAAPAAPEAAAMSMATAAGPFFPVTPRVLSMSTVSPEEVASGGAPTSDPTSDPTPTDVVATPAQAPASVAVASLSTLATPQPVALGSLPVPSAANANGVDSLEPSTNDARRARARRIVFGILGGCAVLVVAALGVSVASGRGETTKAAASTARAAVEPPPSAATTTAATVPEPPAPEPPAAPAATEDRPTPVAAKAVTPVAAPPARPAVAAPATAPRPATAAPAARPVTKPKKPSFDPSGI